MTRITRFNSSLSDQPLWLYKIQLKRGRYWQDFRVKGAVVLFEREQTAKNYASKIH